LATIYSECVVGDNIGPVDRRRRILMSEKKWDPNNISRGTKCFGTFHGSECDGAFPKGFIKWLVKMNWWGEKRCYLCAGLVDDPEAFKVDIRPEMKPDLIADATNTKLPENEYDCVIIDPPYSRDLAKKLYGTEKHYYSINKFASEGARITKPNGLIVTLTYEIPRRVKGCNLIACWGVYTIPSRGPMRCLTVWQKEVT